MTIQEREKLAIKYFTERPDLGHSRILVRYMLENHKIGISDISLKSWLDTFWKKWNKESVAVQVIEESKWSVVDDQYTWQTKRGIINIPVEKIDQLFYEYSEHGLNLSQTEILNKHGLQPWEWSSIKNTLWLFKKSNIFSPYTVQQTPPENMEEMIKGKMEKLFSNTGYQVEQQYNKAINKKFKEVIKKGTERELELQTMLLELQDLLPKADIKPVLLSRDYFLKAEVLNVFIFDLHFGAESRTTQLPLYSPDIIKERFKVIAEEINSHNAKSVHIWFGGDLIESYTGLNHPDAWKGLAKGYYGSKLVIECYKAMIEFISSVANVEVVYGVPGNHDRATDKKELDTHGSIAALVFEFIKVSFKEGIEVKYDDVLISASIDGLHYIMTHGDKKITNAPAAELILEYGDPKAFNILVSGHWHERRVKKDHKNFRQMICPSMFPGNDYSVELGFTTCPGFIIITNNGYNKPKVIDYSL